MNTRNRTKVVLTIAAVAMTALIFTTRPVSAGTLSYVGITNDFNSGISAANSYTHKLDFGTGTPGALINTVQFDAYNAAADGTLNFNRTVSSGTENDNPGNGNHNVSGSLVNLMTDMIYNGNNSPGGTTTWTLSGLTAGVNYDTRIYTRAWGASAGTRNSTIVFDPDGVGAISDSTGVISEDNATGTPPGLTNFNDAYYINYRFTAVASEDLVITATQAGSNASWHLYGISNQVASLYPTTVVGPGADITDAADQDTPGAERLNVDTSEFVTLAAGTYNVKDWALNVFDNTEGGTITPMLLSGSPSSYQTVWLGSAFDPTSNGLQIVAENTTFTLGASTDIYAGFFTAGSGSGIIALDANNSGSGGSATDHDSSFTAPTGIGQTVDAFSNPGLGRTYAFQVNVSLVPEPSTFVLAALGLLGLLACGRRRRR